MNEAALSALKNKGNLSKTLTIDIQVSRTRKEQNGHFACNVAMKLAKKAGKTPHDLANDIVEHLPHSDYITKTHVAGPGFINFYLAEEALCSVSHQILEAGDTYGRSNKGAGKHIHIEFVSANPTGPLHVGHGRSAAYGACVSKLLQAIGYKVHREYYVNDAGRQMRILALSVWLRYLEQFKEPITLPTNAYQGDYIVTIAKKLIKQYGNQYQQTYPDIKARLSDVTYHDKEQYIDTLIKIMQQLIGQSAFEIFQNTALESILSDIKNDLEEFDVTYDQWFHESSLFQKGLLEEGIQLLKAHGHLFEKEGALWFRATEYGDEKDRVLLRANGQPTYFASDIAYHLYKYQQNYDEIIDIFGADHHGYLQRIKAFLKGLGKNPNKLEILLVQFAILYRGKERVSMSTRSGEFVTLRELRHEVGNDAARYFYIMRKPEQHLDFDLELAKSDCNENPVYYIQYAHARICSVWKQMKTNHIVWNKDNGIAHLSLLNQEDDHALIHLLSQYPEVILSAASNREPHVVANFLQSIANSFHSYYNSYRFIINQSTLRDARLCLLAAVQQIIKNGLHLLGLSAPESM